MRPGVHEAARDEYAAICEALARAFDDDPVSVYLFPDASTRAARLRSFYRSLLLLRFEGVVHTDDEQRGAAVWQPPAASQPGALAGALGLLVMLAILRGSALRAQELNRTVVRAQPTGPHWYLGLLGTDPAHQGRGIASALLQPTLARCDAEGVPACLESSKQTNVSFYERHGFRVTHELQVRGGPRLWSMLREPR